MEEKSDGTAATPALSQSDAETAPFVRRLGATIITSLSLIVAMVYTWMAFAMPGGSIESPGAGTWPRIVGSGWIAISVISVAQAVKRVQVSPRDRMPTGDTLALVLKFFAVTVLFVIAIPWLGVYISSSAYAVYTIGLMRARWTVKSAVIGVIFGVSASLMFVELLEVRLPSFPW